MHRLLVPLVFMILLPLSAQAVEPDEMLADPVLEERARVISKDLRCVVCQNQDIDSSNAGVARDLRLLVRERLLEGDSNNQVMAYIQARYGDYVLLKPPFKPSTYALWGTPIALTLIALLFGLNIVMRGRRKSALPELTEAEERQVAKFIAMKNQEIHHDLGRFRVYDPDSGAVRSLAAFSKGQGCCRHRGWNLGGIGGPARRSPKRP